MSRFLTHPVHQSQPNKLLAYSINGSNVAQAVATWLQHGYKQVMEYLISESR